MPNQAEHLLETADVIAVDTEGGEVRVTLGDAARGIGVYREVPIYQSGAFVSVPSEPTDGSSSQALFLHDGSEAKALGWRDNRPSYTDKVGALEAGDAAIISSGEARLLLKRATDLIALFTTNSETGLSMMIAADGDSGELTFSNGDAFLKIKKDEIYMGVNGGSVMRLAKNSLNLQGNGEWKGMVKIGMNCPPGPITPANACAYGVAGPVNTISTSVCISP